MSDRSSLTKQIAFASLFLGAMLYAPSSHAQFLFDDDLSVSAPAKAAPQPPNALADFASYPIHAGSFFLSPQLSLEQQYDTNVFANETNEQSDLVTVIEPSLNIRKAIRDHEFGLNLKASALRYWDNESENIENYDIDFTADLVAHSTLKIPTNISYSIDHRQRLQERSLLSDRASEPLKTRTFRAETGIEYQPNRLMLGLYGGYSRSKFDDGTTTAGAPVIRRDSDATSHSGEILLRYNSKRQWAPFASVLVNKTNFKRNAFDGTGFNGLSRDNTLTRAQVGLAFNHKDLITGNIALGQDWRNYSDAAISDVSDLSAEATLEWNPRIGTSLIFDLSRETEEDNEINNGVTETELSAALNYELQQDLFLRGLLEYRNSDFEDNGRKDDLYGVGAGAYYIINPRLQIGGDIIYNTRDSNQSGSNFDQTRFIARLVGAL